MELHNNFIKQNIYTKITKFYTHFTFIRFLECERIDWENYQARRFSELGVNLNNFTRNGGINVTGCFHTFYNPEAAALFDWGTSFWQLHKHYFSKMIL